MPDSVVRIENCLIESMFFGGGQYAGVIEHNQELIEHENNGAITYIPGARSCTVYVSGEFDLVIFSETIPIKVLDPLGYVTTGYYRAASVSGGVTRFESVGPVVGTEVNTNEAET